ncbi:hypothetical protein IL306_011322 [Fusarium sp. DS 682]|nr:hypothetical protein IL306_011322 [Fusarium sp. DS 682]
MASKDGPSITSANSDDIFKGLPKDSQRYAADVKKSIDKYPWEFMPSVEWDFNSLRALSALLTKWREKAEPQTTSLDAIHAALVAPVQAHHMRSIKALTIDDILQVKRQLFPNHTTTKLTQKRPLSVAFSKRPETPKKVRTTATPETTGLSAAPADITTVARNLPFDPARLNEDSKQPQAEDPPLSLQSNGETRTSTSPDRSNSVSSSIVPSTQYDDVLDNSAPTDDISLCQDVENHVRFENLLSHFIKQQQHIYAKHDKTLHDLKAVSKTRSAQLKAQIKDAEAEVARDQKALDAATKTLDDTTKRINTATEDINLMRSFITSGQALYDKSQASGVMIGPTLLELSDTRRYLSESERQLKIATNSAQELTAKMESSERKMQVMTTKMNELRELVKKEEKTEAGIEKQALHAMRVVKLSGVGEKASQMLEEKYPDFFKELDEMRMPGGSEA